jgi:hypothetical protein
MEKRMKRTLLAGIAAAAAAAALFAGGQALAQSTVVEISPEQRTTIKEYVVREKVKPVTIRESVRVGATIPAEVELVTVPEAWGPSFTRYRYVYSNDNVVLVEPSSRRVIQVID